MKNALLWHWGRIHEATKMQTKVVNACLTFFDLGKGRTKYDVCPTTLNKLKSSAATGKEQTAANELDVSPWPLIVAIPRTNIALI